MESKIRLYSGWVIPLYHEWAGSFIKGARPDAAAPERRTLPAWPFLTVCLPRSPGGGKTLTEKTTAAAAAADAGVVFYNYGGHRINY